MPVYDPYNRSIDYLRISVTSRCNLRCAYCVPHGEHACKSHGSELTFDEIRETVNVAVNEFGFTKVRLTGGEPLLRDDIVELVSMLSTIKGIQDYSLTTNGVFLAQYAYRLKAAGLKRINISLDTLDSVRYKVLTGGADIAPVLVGIAAACDAGFVPIKLNCVVENNADEPDARMVADFARQYGLQARYIKKMELSRGIFGIVNGGTGGDCKTCNRLRLSSDGFIYPCLFNDLRFSLRESGIREALKCAIEAKPQKGMTSAKNRFYRVGG